MKAESIKHVDGLKERFEISRSGIGKLYAELENRTSAEERLEVYFKAAKTSWEQLRADVDRNFSDIRSHMEDLYFSQQSDSQVGEQSPAPLEPVPGDGDEAKKTYPHRRKGETCTKGPG